MHSVLSPAISRRIGNAAAAFLQRGNVASCLCMTSRVRKWPILFEKKNINDAYYEKLYDYGWTLGLISFETDI